MSEMKVKTYKADQLRKTSLQREKESKFKSYYASRSSGSVQFQQLSSCSLNCAHNNNLVLAYKEHCYNNFTKPNNQISNS